MTRAEMLTLPAGRELDRLVAEQMGWAIPSSMVPRYSTDITAAWEVVKVMCDWLPAWQRSKFSLQCCHPVGGHLWECYFGVDRCVAGAADTAPLAICRAALLAKMRGNA